MRRRQRGSPTIRNLARRKVAAGCRHNCDDLSFRNCERAGFRPLNCQASEILEGELRPVERGAAPFDEYVTGGVGGGDIRLDRERNVGARSGGRHDSGARPVDGLLSEQPVKIIAAASMKTSGRLKIVIVFTCGNRGMKLLRAEVARLTCVGYYHQYSSKRNSLERHGQLTSPYIARAARADGPGIFFPYVVSDD